MGFGQNCFVRGLPKATCLASEVYQVSVDRLQYNTEYRYIVDMISSFSDIFEETQALHLDFFVLETYSTGISKQALISCLLELLCV